MALGAAGAEEVNELFGLVVIGMLADDRALLTCCSTAALRTQAGRVSSPEHVDTITCVERLVVDSGVESARSDIDSCLDASMRPVTIAATTQIDRAAFHPAGFRLFSG